ncbi:MAG: toll/interleukin-1 receptor domain-containing protein [Ktedonobacteraceae bacterium]|nr:toll/interleukin-1 receptor domain-containing protein [Ktedonobacteraceae bacterium]
MTTKSKRPVSVYLSYAQKDKDLKEEFEDYLAIMQQNGLISGWVERQVQRGTDWSQVIDPRILTTDLVLVLVSPALLASGYSSGAELQKAFERSETGETRVIPIILHYVNLIGYVLGRVQLLPRDAQPVSSWSNRSEAWENIDRGIRRAIDGITKHY